MAIPERIIIVGAGIGGLTAGLCLRRQGYDVQLVERFDEVREVGAGILLTPNASNVLYNRLGLGDELDAASAPMTRAGIDTWKGKTLFEKSLNPDDFDAPVRMIHRAKLQRVLYEALGAEQVLLSSTVEGFEADHGGVTAITAGGETLSGKILVGADGLHSAVRKQLVGDEEDSLCYHGYTCWRGITDPFGHPDFRVGDLREFQGRGARAGLSYVDEQRLYWWATVNTDKGGRDNPETIHDELAEIYGVFPEPVLAAMEATPASSILRNDIYDRPNLETWGDGVVTLLGDAAHPMTPNLGQGACMAIEDADMLAVCINQKGLNFDALRVYEELRQRRTADIRRLSNRMGEVGQWENIIAVKMREWTASSFAARTYEEQQQVLWGYDASEAYSRQMTL